MKVLVCGSRNISTETERFVCDWLDKFDAEYDITELIEGGALGVDYAAARWEANIRTAHRCYKTNWSLYGKAAGFVRNTTILAEEKPDTVVAFWNGKSPGTKNMIEQAEKAVVKTIVVNI